MTPTVLVVSGPPGSGKTTLAAALSTHLGWPVVSRDAVKAGLVHARGLDVPPSAGGEVAQVAYELLYRFVGDHVAAGVSVIAENAFRCDRSGPELLAASVGARVRIVHASLDRAVAHERFAARAVDSVRRTAHPDAWVLDRMASGEFRWELYEPLAIGAPVLRVDTSDGLQPDLAAIVAFALSAP